MSIFTGRLDKEKDKKGNVIGLYVRQNKEVGFVAVKWTFNPTAVWRKVLAAFYLLFHSNFPSCRKLFFIYFYWLYKILYFLQNLKGRFKTISAFFYFLMFQTHLNWIWFISPCSLLSLKKKSWFLEWSKQVWNGKTEIFDLHKYSNTSLFALNFFSNIDGFWFSVKDVQVWHVFFFLVKFIWFCWHKYLNTPKLKKEFSTSCISVQTLDLRLFSKATPLFPWWLCFRFFEMMNCSQLEMLRHWEEGFLSETQICFSICVCH